LPVDAILESRSKVSEMLSPKLSFEGTVFGFVVLIVDLDALIASWSDGAFGDASFV
jgi:hypothetical protein